MRMRLLVPLVALALLVIAAPLIFNYVQNRSEPSGGTSPPGNASRTQLTTGGAPAAISLTLACGEVPASGSRQGWRGVPWRFVELLGSSVAVAKDKAGGLGTSEKEKDAGATGEVHFHTLTGFRYDFQGVGEYVALRNQALEIQMRLQPYGRSKSVSVQTAVAMRAGGDTIAIYARSAAQVVINHRAVALSDQGLRLPGGSEIRQEGNGVGVLVPGKLKMRVAYGAYLDTLVDICLTDGEQTAGLLAADGSGPQGHFIARDGVVIRLAELVGEEAFRELYHHFADSWRIKQEESLFDYAPGEATQTYTDLNFPYQTDPLASVSLGQRQSAEAACRAEGIADPDPLRECILDVAATGDTGFAANDGVAAAFETLLRIGDNDRSSWSCEGPGGEPGWSCTVGKLAGARPGSMMTLRLETLQSGTKGIETLSCGPVTASLDVTCAERTKGLMFQDAVVVEHYELRSGEFIELDSNGQCPDPRATNDPC